MKNIYIIDDYPSSKNNGIGTYVKALSNCLFGLGFNINIIFRNCEINKFSIVIINGIRHYMIPKFSDTYIYNHKVLVPVLKLYIDDSNDNFFIINHSPCRLFLEHLKKTFPLSKLLFVIHDMGWTEQLLGKMHKLNQVVRECNKNKKTEVLLAFFHEEQNMYDIADKIIVLAEDTFNVIVKIYETSMSKCILIHNGLRDIDNKLSKHQLLALKTKRYINEKEKIILYTGRICQIKGVYSLINSFKLVLKQYPDCRLVLVGTLFENNKAIEVASSISSKVTFTGQISSNEIEEWYNIADIGVLPSYYEQCSYTGIEMMMHGLPIVASDGFCVTNMFQHNINALVAKIGKSEYSLGYEKRLAKQILVLLNNSEKCKILGSQARETYLSKYTIELMQRKYDELFNML